MEFATAQKKGIAFCRACLGTDLSYVGEKHGFDLLRCNDCKTVVVDPYPSEEELASFYHNNYKTEDYLRKQKSKLRRSMGRVKQLLATQPPGKKYLDIGCNVGFTVRAAHVLGLDAHGIDIDAGAIHFAKEHFPDSGAFEAISAQDMAARGDTFDMIYLSEVIEHVPDPDELTAAISKLLRPGGIVYITAPDGGHRAVPRDFVSWDMVTPPQHLTYFTRDGLTRLLGRHGLDVRKFRLAIKPGLKAFARKVAA